MTFDDLIAKHMRAFLADPSAADAAVSARDSDEDGLARTCAALFVRLQTAAGAGFDGEAYAAAARTAIDAYVMARLNVLFRGAVEASNGGARG